MHSECMLTGSPTTLRRKMTSLPLELSWESFTLPVSIMTKWWDVCPCMKRSSSRAKVRTLAHEAISRHSSCERPAKSAEAHIKTARSARMDSAKELFPKDTRTADKLAAAIDPPMMLVQIPFLCAGQSPNSQARFRPNGLRRREGISAIFFHSAGLIYPVRCCVTNRSCA